MQTSLSTEVIPLFSSPVYVTVDDTMPNIMGAVENFVFQNFAGYNLGSQTVEQQILDKVPDFKDWLKEHVDEYVFGVQGIDPLSHTTEFTCSWVNCHQHMERAQDHSHRNSLYSGVVYLDTHNNCGDIMFMDQRHRHLDPRRTATNVYNAKSWRLTPEQGMILIFPSELVHCVEPNMDHNRRYSLAFNVMVKGNYGNPTSFLTL